MCGFAGYKSLHDGAIDAALLQELATILEHRGPDDVGIWTDQAHRVALVSRRLSIIDISAAGAQPMSDSDQTVVLVYNGEIYNYQQLRAELEKKNIAFDRTVILKFYYTHIKNGVLTVLNILMVCLPELFLIA